MKPAFGAALRAAILCGAAIAVSACVYEPYHHRGYDRYGDSGYYGDPCDQDRSYCDYPMYEGGIYIGGNWYEGRHRYRDNNGKREFYLHGNWYSADQTRDRDHDRDWRDHERDHDSNGGRDWHDHDHDHSNWRDRDHDNDRDNDRDDDHGPRQLHDHDRDHDGDGHDNDHDNDHDHDNDRH